MTERNRVELPNLDRMMALHSQALRFRVAALHLVDQLVAELAITNTVYDAQAPELSIALNGGSQAARLLRADVDVRP